MVARHYLAGCLWSSALVLGLTASAAMAEDKVGIVEVSKATETSLTLYPDKALVRQQFKVLPGPGGLVVVEGMARDWQDDSLELEYIHGNQGQVPVNLTWQRGGLDRDRLYRRLVGRSVEMMGGGLNVPVQGVMLSYDSGMGLVQGTNGRQYLVDWNDPEGIRLATRDAVFLEKDYQTRLMANFSEVEGTDKLRLSYITPSIHYSSQYRMTISQNNSARLELSVLLNNNTDTDYSDSSIKLVAGDLGMSGGYSRKRVMMEASADRANQGNQRVGEVLVTQLPEESTKLTPYSLQQITLYKRDQLKLDKFYQLDVYGRSSSGRGPSLEKPRLNYRFKAERDLPAGNVRMYEETTDGSVVISGNASLPQTTKGDNARLTLGEALAVRVERNRLDNQQRDNELSSRWQATVYNDKDEAISLVLNDRDRSLLKLTDVKGGTLENTSTIKVTVPAQSKKEFTYSAVYGK
jgi:hypothetical protein